MRKQLSNRNVRLLCCGSFISSIGDNLYNIGLTLSLYMLSGSVAAVANMWLIRALIRIPGQMVGGVIADRYNRKHISVGINFFSALLCFLLVYTGKENLNVTYGIIFLLQATSDIDNAASMAMVPELVAPEDLIEVNSLFSLVGTISLFVAPALAGILFSQYGVDTLYILNGFSFLIGSAMFALIQYVHRTALTLDDKQHFKLFSFAMEGFKVTVQSKVICSVIAMMMAFAVLGRFYEIYKVHIADAVLGIGAVGIVYFSYAMALGSLMAPLCIKGFNRIKLSSNQSLAVVSLATTIGFMILGLSENRILSCVSVWLIGLFQTNMSVYTNGMIQRAVQNQYLGRVFSFYKVAMIVSAILGIVIAAPMLSWFGLTVPFVLFSVIGILLIGWTDWQWLQAEKEKCEDQSHEILS